MVELRTPGLLERERERGHWCMLQKSKEWISMEMLSCLQFAFVYIMVYRWMETRNAFCIKMKRKRMACVLF